MRIAIDIGQHTGFAVFTDDGQFISTQTVGLGCSKKKCPFCGTDSRALFELRALEFYGQAFTDDVKEVSYEKVARHNGPISAQLWGYGQGLILAHCQRLGIPVQPIHVSTWKARIGVRGGGKDAYITKVNELTGLSLTLAQEDAAAAAGIGFAAFAKKP